MANLYKPREIPRASGAHSLSSVNDASHEWTGEYFADDLGHFFSWKSPDQIHQNVKMWEAMSHDLLQTYMEAGNPEVTNQLDMSVLHKQLGERMSEFVDDISKAVARHTIE